MRFASAMMLLLAGLVLTVVCARGSRAEEPASNRPSKPLVLAHYMPWFKAEPRPGGAVSWDHWQWFGKGPKHDPDDFLPNGRRDIASVFYPLIGPYDGRAADVLEYHMLTARASGLEGFVADWYGPGSSTDELFAQLVKAGERYNFAVAICLEEKAFFPGYAQVRSRPGVLDEMERQVRHVLDTHARSPAYLRWNGKPVFFMFNGYGNTTVGWQSLSPQELADVLGRFAKTPVLLVRGHCDSNYLGVVGGNYAWCGDAKYRADFYARAGAARAAGQLDFCVGVASPGFDDSGVYGWGQGPRVTDRRDGQEYEDNWRQLLEARPDAVQIVTWNDFQEGTTVEPAHPYGYQYLDLTERYVGELTGRPVFEADNHWGYRVYLLRDALARAGDAAAARQCAARLDRFVQDVVHGRGWFMGWRLNGLEREARQALQPTAPGSAAP